MPGSHDRIIAEAAKSALGPLGFLRKGRSRIWLADHNWWVTVVEFQPSAWSKGSYLNVAAHFLWSNNGTLSFNFGGRVEEHVDYVSDVQFAPVVAQLSQRAAAETQRLGETFCSVPDAAEVLLATARKSGFQGALHPDWLCYDAGVAAGLVGKADVASKMFARVLDTSASQGTVLHAAAERMADLVVKPRQFKEEVVSLIAFQRDALKLPPLASNPF